MLRRVLKIIGIVLATLFVATVLLVIFVAPSEDESKKPQGGSRAGVREPVELKGIAYTVTNVRKTRTLNLNPESEISLVVKAQGVFVAVSVTWKNVTDEPKGSTVTAPMLLGGNGKTYGLDHAASENTFAYELQPDFSERGTLIFDVTPAAAKGARLRFEECDLDLTDEDLRSSCEDAEIDLGLR